jgi:hypothetical protein
MSNRIQILIPGSNPIETIQKMMTKIAAMLVAMQVIALHNDQRHQKGYLDFTINTALIVFTVAMANSIPD